MKRIIDARKKEKFMIDDEFIDKMARLCCHQGTIVYTSLCRRTDRGQECFPSIQLMAEEHGVSTRTILRGLKKLSERNVIKIGKTRKKDGKWLNNTYTLLDKSVWKYDQVTNSHMDSHVTKMDLPCDKNDGSHVTYSHTKETHIRKPIKKETHIAKASFADEFDLKSYIEEMIGNKQKHISLIGGYFKFLLQENKINFPSKKAIQVEIKRWIKDAMTIVEYTEEQRVKATDHVMKEFPEYWNLGTVAKYINKF